MGSHEACTQLDPHRVRCAFASSQPINVREISAGLGDGDDRAVFTGPERGSVMFIPRGEDGDDDLISRPGSYYDLLNGGPGDDDLESGAAHSESCGGPGDDTMIGGPGVDALAGGAGSDVLYGNGGDDVLQAAACDSSDVDDTAPDQVYRGDGNDALSAGGGAGTDLLDGGAGEDTADYDDHWIPVSVSLDGIDNDGATGENDQLRAIENLTGASAESTLTGDDGPNVLSGSRTFGAGVDHVDGRGGDDRIDVREPAGAGAVADDVTCGAGLDDVTADALDVLAPDCETVAVG